jgi:toxin YoeB
MAKQVVWSIRAKEEKKAILRYWNKRNRSSVYPKRLDGLFKQAINTIAKYNIPRRKANYDGVYVKIVKDYLVFFEEDQFTIYILSVWDSRQDPNKLKNLLK